jgi:hypothetical protein
MKGEAQFTVPELARVLGTRAALGVGLGLLLANRFSEEQRRTIGWTLLLTGGFSAATMALELFGRPRSLTWGFGTEPGTRGLRSEATERVSQPDAFARA